MPAQGNTSIVPLTSGPTGCTHDNHLCGPPDPNHGCASCGFTCHRDCCSSLCSFTPCPYCVSLSLNTHENSALCIEAQMYNLGCHACGRQGCWTGSATCWAKCTRVRHVCISATDGSGCTSCGKPCHSTNADPLCTFFQRARGCVAWTINAQQLLDTEAGTQGSVPHMSQLPWTFTITSRTQVLVDGVAYRRGYGFPGTAQMVSLIIA